MSLDRRAFLATLAAALAVPRRGSAETLPRLGAQLYTVRTLLEKDFDATLAGVAALGYSEVEFAGYFNRTPHRLREPDRGQVVAGARECDDDRT